MIEAIIYRYPHPIESGKYLYVGQDSRGKRDREHRSGKTSFGRRFAKLFPGIILPIPETRMVCVENVVLLNLEETQDIFKYKTWHEQGGMNLCLPGSADYKQSGSLGNREGKRSGGRRSMKIQLAKFTPEQWAERGRKASLKIPVEQRRNSARKGGLMAWRNGSITLDHQIKAGRIGGAICGPIQGRKNVESGQVFKIPHIRWHVKRGIKKTGCSFCEVKL